MRRIEERGQIAQYAWFPAEEGIGMAGYVLVVDDDQAIREAVALALELAGFPSRTASNGKLALAAVEAEEPLLMVLDLRMPVMTGEEVVRALTEAGHTIPVIVVSADHRAERTAQEAGAFACLPKPFRVADLIRTVRSALAQAA
jgi:CheY-like chemotaxis protein